MRTYRELFRCPEFTPLFATSTLQVAATTVSSLALGTLVYTTTRSPLLSALAMFGPSLAQLLGAATLLSAADRLPPRAATAGAATAFGAGTALLALPGLPLWAFFTVLGVLGLVSSVAGGVRYGMLSSLLPPEGYVLGRSVLNMSVGTTQICGFALGGSLVTLVSPRGTLLVGAALNLVTVAVALLGLRPRPARGAGRPSVAATWRGNVALLAPRPRRRVYIALCVPNGLIVGCESLFVAYSPSHAGLLFASSAVGMLVGDTVSGRFVPSRRRERLGPLMRLLLAWPYLLFALRPSLPVAAALIMLASVGYCATLMLQERLLALTPESLHGQALGLHSSAMLAMQGVGAAVAGAVAQAVPVPATMALMAAVSVAVTLSVSRGLAAGVGARAASAVAGRRTLS
jgi:predicted MFS family arabinose efflux permease